MVEKLGRALGYELDAVREPLTATASVTSLGEGHFRADLRTTFRGETRARVLEGESCAAVSDAVVLVLAFLVDPEAASATVEAGAASSEPTSTATANFELTPPPPARPQPESKPRPSTAPTVVATPERDEGEAKVARAASQSRPWLARANVGVDTGTLPATTSVFGLAFGRSFGPFSLELSGARYSPRERTLPEQAPTKGGDFRMWALGAALGYRLLARTVEVSPWLGAELGTVYGSGFGVALPKQGQGLWLAGALGVSARYRALRWLGASGQAGLALPVVRPTYVLENVGDVYRADFLTVRGSVGLEVYF